MGKHSEEAAFMVFHKRCLWLWAQNHKQRLWKIIKAPFWKGLWFYINAVYGFGPQNHKQNHKRFWLSGGTGGILFREYCFGRETHWVLRQTRWVLPKTRWVRFGTQIIAWKELTEFAPRNSVSRKKLTEFGVWNRTPRNRIRPVSDFWGACLKWWKQFQERSTWNPQRQFGEESLKIGRWIGTMMFIRTRYNEKTLQLQLDRRNKDHWKGQSCAILDLLVVDPPSFKFFFFCFLCLELFVCNSNKMTWGDRSKKHTHTR